MATIDLEALRAAARGTRNRRAVKTFLTAEAHERVKAAAEYAGMFDYEIIEQAIMHALPPEEELFEEDAS